MPRHNCRKIAMDNTCGPTNISPEDAAAINKLAGERFFITIPPFHGYFIMVEVVSPVRALSKRHILPSPDPPALSTACKKRTWYHAVSGAQQPSTAHIKRVRISGTACMQCHESRIRCSDAANRPCARCVIRGIGDRCTPRSRKKRVVVIKRENLSIVAADQSSVSLPLRPGVIKVDAVPSDVAPAPVIVGIVHPNSPVSPIGAVGVIGAVSVAATSPRTDSRNALV